MDQEVKQKWVTALRSGQYIQGKGALKKIDPSSSLKTQHCCLGVLCEVLEVTQTRATGTYHFSFGEGDDARASYLSPALSKKVDLDVLIQNDLAKWNDTEDKSDGHLDFNEIANWIEENL